MCKEQLTFLTIREIGRVEQHPLSTKLRRILSLTRHDDRYALVLTCLWYTFNKHWEKLTDTRIVEACRDIFFSLYLDALLPVVGLVPSGGTQLANYAFFNPVARDVLDQARYESKFLVSRFERSKLRVLHKDGKFRMARWLAQGDFVICDSLQEAEAHVSRLHHRNIRFGRKTVYPYRLFVTEFTANVFYG